MAGYIRCSRLVKRAPFDDGDISPPAPIDVGPEKKKSKNSAIIPLTALNIAAASSSNGAYSLGGGSMNGNGDVQENKAIVSDTDEEYVCSIRPSDASFPADASFPHSRGSLFSSLLSTASIVANTNVSNNPDQPLPPQPHEYNYPLLHQRGNFPPQSHESYPPQQKNNINISSQNSQNRYLNYRPQPNGSNGHNQQQGSNNFYSQFQGSSNNPMDRSASIPAEGNDFESNVPEGKEQGDLPL
jgi:hypothetical protein